MDKRSTVLLICILLFANSHWSNATEEVFEEPTSLEKKLEAALLFAEGQNGDMGRSLISALSPFGEMWQSASRLLGKGVHKFRESLREGVKVAHMLKDDMDEGVAKLMSSSNPSDSINSPHESMDEQQLLREGVLGGLLRFMGVNSNQLGVIALNVLIIVAEWITSSVIGGNENGIATSRMVKDNLLEWVVKGRNPKIEALLHEAKDHSLPENIIKTLEKKTGNSTACVQLLICKMSPVIWGVQKTVDTQVGYFRSSNVTSGRASTSASSVIDTFLETLPPKGAFVNFGDHCEKRFPYCKLLKFDTKPFSANETSKGF